MSRVVVAYRQGSKTEVGDLAENYLKLYDLQKEIKTAMDKVKEELIHTMAKEDILHYRLQGRVVSFKQAGTQNRVNTPLFKKCYPKVYQACVKEVNTSPSIVVTKDKAEKGTDLC